MMTGSLTRRYNNSDHVKRPSPAKEESFLTEKCKSNGENTVKEWIFALILALFMLILLLLHVDNRRYPRPLTKLSSKNGKFIEENARQHLIDITNFGPRPAGSIANEVHTVNYLLNEIEKIKTTLKPVHNLEVDVQSVSGTFSLVFLGGMTSYYENVQNVLVKFGSSKNHRRDSIMVNCHFDSVINGTGASDDAISCAVMLEVLRVLSQTATSFKHDIIFLFNGAEENILQASHGFITQHEWASDIKAFVNLDSAGAGGKELVFQAGPENPWMVYTYAQNAPHPFATVLGQDVFQSGLIPSDTDFRIFRDYGHLPGIDIAYITNGYVYHTQYDVPEMIPPGCIQRAGDNLLEVLKGFADSAYLSDPGEYRHGKVIFFDVVGLYMIVYPANIGSIINLGAAAVILMGLARQCLSPRTGYGGARFLKDHLVATLFIIVSWVCAILSAALTAIALDTAGMSLSWYTNTWLLLPLYACPSIISMLTVHCMAKKHLFKTGSNVWETERLFFGASMAIYASILMLLTNLGVGSAVLFLFCILCPFMFRTGLASILQWTPQKSPLKFFALHVAGIIFPCLMLLYALYGLFTMFVPIMGRAGTEAVPDLFIGCLVSLGVILVFSLSISLVYVCETVSVTRKLLTCIYLTCLILVFITPEGFPFSADPHHPTKQRHFAYHIDRTMHDITGAVTHYDTGLLHIGFDRPKVKYVKHVLPGLAETEEAECDTSRPYCGWPYYFPVLNRMRDVHYMKATPLVVSDRATLDVISKSEQRAGHVNITFAVTGPSHITLYITPKDGVTLTEWSLGNHDPLPTEMAPGMARETFFVYYAYGTKPDKPWQFWLDMQVADTVDRSGGILDLALGAHYVTDTPDLLNYIGAFPEWTTPIGWVSTYEAWIF